MKKIKIDVVSSLAQDTGSFIRAFYLADSLKKAGTSTRLIKAFPKTYPFNLDLLISLPYYLYQIIFSRADIIITVKSYPNVGIPLLIRKLLPTKIVIDTDDLSFAYSQGLWSKLSKISQEIFLPLADLHTSHNNNLLQYLAKLGIAQEKIYKLEQGVNIEMFHSKNMAANKIIKKQYGLGERKILTFVGHFDIACDLEFILKAVAPVLKNDQNLALVLIGDGRRRGEFENLAQKLGTGNQIIWTGMRSQKEVVKLLAISDLCLLYYQNNTANKFRVSLKLREYLSLGRKVVCTNTGELADFAKFTYQTEAKLSEYSLMIGKVLKTGGDKREIKGKTFIKQLSWDIIGRKFAKRLDTL